MPTPRLRDLPLRRSAFYAAPVVGMLGIVVFVALLAPWALRNQPYASPKQPIAFSHQVHVEQLGLDCAFCHRTADTGVTAGYPDVQQCMFCHQVVSQEVAATTRASMSNASASGVTAASASSSSGASSSSSSGAGDGPRWPATMSQPVRAGPSEIEKVRQAWLQGEPIDWIRVHRMPDHSFFVHEAHLRAGVSCLVCHGNVGAMDAAVKVRSLNMADCVSCHVETQAPVDCATCHK